MLLSCSYEKTSVDFGSLFGSTWDFNKSSNYDYDSNYVEITNGEAQLKTLDLDFSGADFNAGLHTGTEYSNSSLSINVDKQSDQYFLNNILPTNSNNLEVYLKFENNINNFVLGGVAANSFGSLTYSSDSQIGLSSVQSDNSLTNRVAIPGFDVAGDSFTASIWVNPSAHVDWQRILSEEVSGASYDWQIKEQAVDGDFHFQIRMTDGNTCHTNQLSGQFAKVPLNKWTHLVVRYNHLNNEISLFQDGVLSSLPRVCPLPIQQVVTGLGVGSNPLTGQNSFSGSIDELGFWRVALDDVDIKKIYNSQSRNTTELSELWAPKWDNIVGYWKMDGNWQDSSPNNYHGTPLFDVTHDSAEKKVGSASAALDGSGDRVEMGDILNLVGEPISISLWVKMNSYSGAAGLVYKFSSGGYRLHVKSDGTVFFQISSGGGFQSQQTTASVPLNEWTHIAVAHDDATTGKIFINGKLESFKTDYFVSKVAVADAFNIGRDNFGGQSLDGNIDEVAIWNEVLTNEDVSTIFHRQKQKYASHYDSEVIDLGGVTSAWPDLSWVTRLPFGKELVGDFDNDGNPDTESLSHYSDLSANLNQGLVGYWNFNEKVLNSAPGGLDFFDISGGGNHGIETSGVQINQSGKLNGSVNLGLSADYVTIPHSTNFDFGTSDFSVAGWIKTNDSASSIFATSNSVPGTVFTIFANHSSSSAPRAYLSTGGAFCTVDGSFSITDGQWHHLAFVFKRGSQCIKEEIEIYIDGKLDESRTLQNAGAGSSNFNITNSADLWFGRRLSGGSQLIGNIDEMAIWNRSLVDTEIQQLYRRGANRVKLQVKSCIDSNCECKSYNVAPVGSAADCDGDGILNSLDNDDIYKAEFIGPGGDETTYYSEYYNRNSADVLFSCALNTSDSNPGICVEDEVTMVGSSKPTNPEFLNLDYSQFVNPTPNRYAQYRVYMEADSNTACGGEPCLPELSSVSLNPTVVPKYYGNQLVVKPKKSYSYKKISAISIIADPCASFQLSPDETNYYYWDGSAWVIATDDSIHTSPELDVETNIVAYSDLIGAGKLYLKVFLATSPDQTQQCQIKDIDVSN